MSNVESIENYSQTAEYRAWYAMKYRCTVEKSPNWDSYGGRGIKVCDRWLESFDNFYADMGPRPSDDHSLDRKDNDGNYEPNNCRWATVEEQMNNRRVNVFVDYNGRRLTLTQVARTLGVNPGYLNRSYRRGMTFDEIVETPEVKRVLTLYSFRGESKTLPQWSREKGINYLTLTQRLKNGWSFEEALTRPVASIKSKSVTYDGQTMTVREWAKKAQIDCATLRFRLRSNWSFGEAISTPSQRKST